MSKFSEQTDFTKQVIGQETYARINFFLKNKDLIYQNSDAENKFTKRLERIRQETDEVNKLLNENKWVLQKQPLKREEIKDHKQYMKKMGESYPELSDSRCFFHPMRKVSNEYLEVLYSNSNKEGTKEYIQARSKLQPEKKYYFPETTSFDYGWKMTGLPKANSSVNKYNGREFSIKNFVWRKNGLTMFQHEKQVPLTCTCPMVCNCQ